MDIYDQFFKANKRFQNKLKIKTQKKEEERLKKEKEQMKRRQQEQELVNIKTWVINNRHNLKINYNNIISVYIDNRYEFNKVNILKNLMSYEILDILEKNNISYNDALEYFKLENVFYSNYTNNLLSQDFFYYFKWLQGYIEKGGEINNEKKDYVFLTKFVYLHTTNNFYIPINFIRNSIIVNDKNQIVENAFSKKDVNIYCLKTFTTNSKEIIYFPKLNDFLPKPKKGALSISKNLEGSLSILNILKKGGLSLFKRSKK